MDQTISTILTRLNDIDRKLEDLASIKSDVANLGRQVDEIKKDISDLMNNKEQTGVRMQKYQDDIDNIMKKLSENDMVKQRRITYLIGVLSSVILLTDIIIQVILKL